MSTDTLASRLEAKEHWIHLLKDRECEVEALLDGLLLALLPRPVLVDGLHDGAVDGCGCGYVVALPVVDILPGQSDVDQDGHPAGNLR